MSQQTFFLENEQATENLAQRFIMGLKAPMNISFSGEIGAGKTSFIRAMFIALGVDAVIKSPTFSLVESYESKDLQLYHFDLYRIEDETELEYIGFRDYFNEKAICCIEWPERLQTTTVFFDIKIALQIQDKGRLIQLEALSESGEQALLALTGIYP